MSQLTSGPPQDGLNDKELQTLIAEAREEFPLKKPKDVGMDA
jgi:hypothetical protein